MAIGGFGPYHRLWPGDAPSKRIVVPPTPWAMMPALGFCCDIGVRELLLIPPQRRICPFCFVDEKNVHKTINMHLL